MLWSRLLVSCLLVVSVHSIAVITNLTAFNWELSGCFVPDILGGEKDCNASYAYAVAATVQLVYCVHTGKVALPLSAKQIIKCSTSFGNNGCEGGSAVNAFEYVVASKGLNPAIYDATSPPCSAVLPGALKIKGFTCYENVTEDFLIDLLVRIGPLVVGVDASLPSFKNWLGFGIYNDANCKNGLSDLTHDAVLTGVGNDIFTGEPYWEFVIGFGPLWATGGRMDIARANNLCGIRTRVCHPEIPQQ